MAWESSLVQSMKESVFLWLCIAFLLVYVALRHLSYRISSLFVRSVMQLLRKMRCIPLASMIASLRDILVKNAELIQRTGADLAAQIASRIETLLRMISETRQ